MNSSRAARSGSSGGANGSLSMTTSDSASPCTSTPSQKLWLPRSTALPSARKRVSSSLHEQRIVESVARERGRDRLARPGERAQRGEQEKSAASACLEDRKRRGDDG